MTTISEKKPATPALHIATSKDIPNGLGLGVKTKEIIIREVRTGTTHKAKSKSQFFSADLEATFCYDAGYVLTAQLFAVSSSSDIDVTDDNKLVDFIKNGDLNIKINLNNEFDEETEWWLIANNDHILKEIESVSEEWAYYTGLYSVGEYITFPHGPCRKNLSYEIEDCLQFERENRPTTGFTQEFVESVYSRLRAELLSFLGV